MCRKIHYGYHFSAWKTLPRWGSARQSSVPDPVSEPMGRQLHIWVKKYFCLRNLLSSHSDGFNVLNFFLQQKEKEPNAKSKLQFVLLQSCFSAYKAFKAKKGRAYPFNAILSELLSCHADRNGGCASGAEISDTLDIK